MSVRRHRSVHHLNRRDEQITTGTGLPGDSAALVVKRYFST
jgi:hypothetical protein